MAEPNESQIPANAGGRMAAEAAGRVCRLAGSPACYLSVVGREFIDCRYRSGALVELG